MSNVSRIYSRPRVIIPVQRLPLTKSRPLSQFEAACLGGTVVALSSPWWLGIAERLWLILSGGTA
ncbi:hypothetical protein JCM17845_15240 [Iodidimonas gelatinilytica]|uniref:Uncharacterized protein n=1 Tax=Iodidimonas gelatinilytica TaxID=1236966 RepID=A0A5A7MXU8_9PROT|nr:hypothetical protein [Iodidimonas gelatinilytica]GER00901.1 hypothetical protein JCM17845_15240 [Iodidimonas gelatinilytica]